MKQHEPECEHLNCDDRPYVGPLCEYHFKVFGASEFDGDVEEWLRQGGAVMGVDLNETARYEAYLLTSPTPAEAREQLGLLEEEGRRRFSGIWGATAELLAHQNACKFFRSVLKRAKEQEPLSARQMYWRACAEVREWRGNGQQKSAADVDFHRAAMAELEDLFDALTPQQQKIANTSGWRSWPETVGITQAALLVNGFTWTLQPPARHDRLVRFWLEVTGEKAMPEHEKGFMTSEGVFVNRREALAIALRARQVFGATDRTQPPALSIGGVLRHELTTEDLW